MSLVAAWEFIRPEGTMEISGSEGCANVSAVPLGRIKFIATIPATLWLANIRLCLRHDVWSQSDPGN
jgi:hypothetical protein